VSAVLKLFVRVKNIKSGPLFGKNAKFLVLIYQFIYYLLLCNGQASHFKYLTAELEDTESGARWCHAPFSGAVRLVTGSQCVLDL